MEVDPPVAEPDQSTPQTVSEPAGEDFSAGTSTSGRVAVGDTATGNIGSNGDRDWFAVELVAGRTYVIDLRGSRTDDGTLSDPYLGGIHDSDGNLIPRTTNDDGGEGYNSRVTFTATESGTHYIAAGAAGVFSGQGTYEVEVTDTSPPIVAPDPDSEEPPDTQEQVQQQPPAFGSQFYAFRTPGEHGRQRGPDIAGHGLGGRLGRRHADLQHRGRQRGGAVRDRRSQRRAVLHGRGRGLRDRFDQLRADCPGERRGSDDRHHRDRQRHRRGGSTGVWAGGLRLRSGGERGSAARTGYHWARSRRRIRTADL